MRKVHPAGVARRRVLVKHELVATHQVDGAVFQGSDPELRPLKVEQDRDWPAKFLFKRTDHLHPLAHIVMARVAHVDPKHVSACPKKVGERGPMGRRRTQRRNDLAATEPSHRHLLL